MINTEIFIEGLQADLSADVSALFTYSLADVKEFDSRDTAYSKTIVFPGTNQNHQLFGHAFEFTAYNEYDSGMPNIGSNFNAAKAARCLVLLDGVQIFKGILRLLEIKILNGAIEYEAFVTGELGGLITAIGNRKLTGNTDTAGYLSIADDLDFSSYNQDWNFTNITQSWADLAVAGYLGYGVYWPLIDYGNTTPDRVHYSYQAMRPALYVHEYLVKIFEKAGYTFECPFFETPFFLRQVIPHNEDKIYKMVRMLVKHQRFGAMPALLESATPGVGGTLTSAVVHGTSIELNNFTVNGGGASFTYNAGQPTIPISISVPIAFRSTGGQHGVRVTVSLLFNGVPIDDAVFQLDNPGPTFNQYNNVLLQASGVLLAPGDIIAVHAVAVYPGIPPLSAWEVFVTSSTIAIEAQYAVAAPASFGDPLSINNLIPKGILQKDLLISIVKMFNLYILEDPQRNRHLKILPYPDFFDNSDPLDWTNKVDRSRDISLKPMSEVNAKYFNFLYEKDNDYDNDTYYKRYAMGYGDRTYDSGLDFVKDKKDLKIIFAPTPIVGLFGNDKAVSRIMKADGNGVETRTESKIRILQAKRMPAAAWNLLDDDLATVLSSSVYYGYAGHVDDPGTPQGADLNFGAPAEIYWVPANPYTAPNLFNVCYSAYMAEITNKDSKLLTCYVRLSQVDIYALNFARAIRIDGQLWRLNRAIDYNAAQEDVTKVELLKVINLSY